MADDVNPALRAELNAALEVLAPQIRGLQDLAQVSLSEGVKQALQAAIAFREKRVAFINAVLAFLDNSVSALGVLEQHGYPAIPKIELPGDLFGEIPGQHSDLDIAFGQIVSQSPASAIVFDPPVPADK